MADIVQRVIAVLEPYGEVCDTSDLDKLVEAGEDKGYPVFAITPAAIINIGSSPQYLAMAWDITAVFQRNVEEWQKDTDIADQFTKIRDAFKALPSDLWPRWIGSTNLRVESEDDVYLVSMQVRDL